MPSLLVSLGNSPAIVPEAFLLPGVAFEAVHVITTERPDVAPIKDFFDHKFPNVTLTLSRVAGFNEFTGEDDHFNFEEVLYRWFLATDTRPDERYVCVAGGFKTMSAAVQKAASVLGAAEVFHVLADMCCLNPKGEACPPQTPDEILRANELGKIHFIRLGPESGWPQFRHRSPSEFPLKTTTANDGVRHVLAPDQTFRDRLRSIVERSHNIAGAWDRLASLPFPELATWPAADLAWLDGAIDPFSPADQAWVAALPKVELHCHLGGFATDGNALLAIRIAARDPGMLPPIKAIDLPSGWPLPATPCGLEPYRALGDNNGSALLKDPGCLRAQCEALYAHFVEQNIVYAEVRCSPANYITPGRSPFQVLTEIRDAFAQAMAACRPDRGRRARCHVNLIVIGTRQTTGDFRAGIARHSALAIAAAEHWSSDVDCRVVGVDLAGFEDPSTRAHYFREEFTGVHRCGLALTVHAGENDDAEGVWRAVFDLNARRLGHALSLGQSLDLMRSVADRGVAVEMCPYANLQIKGFPLDSAAVSAPANVRYPLASYLGAGIRVTVNTDNIGISAASLADNLLLAARLCPGLTRLDLLRLQRNALDAAFVSPRQRTSLLSRLHPSAP